MQNSVFNRKLFQTKEARNTLREMGGVNPEISGIVASSQPLINEAMSAVRRPETSAIPMDIAMGMNATRAPSMSDPMQPAGAMPMPAGNTDLLAPPPVAAPAPAPAPAPQMAEAPSLNPMQPGVKAMAGGGETTPEEPGFFSQLNTGFNKGMEKYITATRPFSPLSKAIDESDIDITDEAGTVEQQLQEINDVINDPDVLPKDTMKSVVVIAGGNPAAKDLKAEADRVNRKLGMPKLNTKQSFSKMLKNIQGNLESSAGFALAASKNPRLSGAVAEAGKGLADQTLALEVDAQKTAAANAETERLLRLKAALTPASSKTGFENEPTQREATLTLANKLIASGEVTDPQEAMQAATAALAPLYATAAAPASGGGEIASNQQANDAAAAAGKPTYMFNGTKYTTQAPAA